MKRVFTGNDLQNHDSHLYFLRVRPNILNKQICKSKKVKGEPMQSKKPSSIRFSPLDPVLHLSEQSSLVLFLTNSEASGPEPSPFSCASLEMPVYFLLLRMKQICRSSFFQQIFILLL